jgi:hypothetical protein
MKQGFWINPDVFSQCIQSRIINDNTPYYIVNYKKGRLNSNDISQYGRYKSALFTYPEKRLLSIFPPKALPYDVFMEKISDRSVIWVNEVVDGLAVNLFFSDNAGQWSLATRYNKATENVYNMFLEGLTYEYERKVDNQPIQLTQPFFELLPKQYCYSFIIQHPEINNLPNRLLMNRATVYLVAVHELWGEQAIYIPASEYEQWRCFQNGVIEFPKRLKTPLPHDSLPKSLPDTFLPDDSLSDVSLSDTFLPDVSLSDTFLSDVSLSDVSLPKGCILTNMETGERTKILDPEYNLLKQHCLTPPHMIYQYLCLKRINKVDDFLLWHPHIKPMFRSVSKFYKAFINKVHRLYMDYYVFTPFRNENEKRQRYLYADKVVIFNEKRCKNNNTNEHHALFMNHIHIIHETVYLPSLIKITKPVIDHYMEQLPPNEVLLLLL